MAVKSKPTISYHAMDTLTWPPTPLPWPPGPPGWEYEITEAGAIVAVVPARQSRSRPPARAYHESYLHLLALDLYDETAVWEWLNRFGPLAIVEPERVGFTFHRGWFLEVAGQLRQEGERIVQEMPYWDEMAGDDEHFAMAESLLDFRWQAECLRDLVRAWRWYSEDEEPAAWESRLWQYDDPNFPGAPKDRLAAGRLVELGLATGLRPFHPFVRLGPLEEGQTGPGPYASDDVGFYSIACLELFNHIAEGAGYTTCANEPCRRLFVRQEGRANEGQHRTTGVKYCSRDCARAQAQRNYRRRKQRSGDSR